MKVIRPESRYAEELRRRMSDRAALLSSMHRDGIASETGAPIPLTKKQARQVGIILERVASVKPPRLRDRLLGSRRAAIVAELKRLNGVLDVAIRDFGHGNSILYRVPVVESTTLPITGSKPSLQPMKSSKKRNGTAEQKKPALAPQVLASGPKVGYNDSQNIENKRYAELLALLKNRSTINRKDFVTKLEKAGMEFRAGRGSHLRIINPETGMQSGIKYNVSGEDARTVLIKRVLSELGILDDGQNKTSKFLG